MEARARANNRIKADAGKLGGAAQERYWPERLLWSVEPVGKV